MRFHATRHRSVAQGALPLVGFYVSTPANQTDWNRFTKSGATGGVGLTPIILETFIDKSVTWANINTYSAYECSANLKAAWEPTVAQGAVPLCDMYTVQSASGTNTANWAAVAAGTYDSNIIAYLTGFKTGGFSNIYLRIDSEMNLGSYAWFVSGNTNMVAELAAWKHIANLAHGISGLTIKTIWNPQAGTIYDMNGMYPSGSGSNGRYVDLIGLDSYATWNVPNHVGNNTSAQLDNMCLLARTNGLPFCLCETGCDLGSYPSSGNGNDWAGWINSLAAELVAMVALGTTLEFVCFYCSGGNYTVLDGTHPDIVTAIRNLFITLGLSPA